MRYELISYLEEIVQFENKDELYINDNFDYVIHFLFDDTTIAENQFEDIGVFFIKMKKK